MALSHTTPEINSAAMETSKIKALATLAVEEWLTTLDTSSAVAVMSATKVSIMPAAEQWHTTHGHLPAAEKCYTPKRTASYAKTDKTRYRQVFYFCL